MPQSGNAKLIKDWALLDRAVETQIEEQKQFVAWWHANIGIEHGGNRRSKIQVARPGYLKFKDAEKRTGIKQRQVSRWGQRLAAVEKYRQSLWGPSYFAAMGEEHNHRAQGTGENEWNTPPEYVAHVREVLGEIDLDPATNEIAQRIIKARKFFTAADDGLRHEWHGHVFLNPPYVHPKIVQFAEKMVEERSAGRVTAGIMLTHNYTDTRWFHAAVKAADAVCFTLGRIKFLDKDGNECAPTQGQAFFYLGSDVEKFSSVFADVGFVL